MERRQWVLSRTSRVGLIAFLSICVWASRSEADTARGNRAFAALVNVPTLGADSVGLADTGSLSRAGWEGAGLLTAALPGILSTETLVAAASRTGDTARSSASLAEVVLLPGHAAELTTSFARAESTAAAGGSSGSIEIYELRFGDVDIVVTGLPNQRVDIFGVATLVINEQIVNSTASSESITVNALHLTLATGEEIILASASSQIDKPQVGLLNARNSGESLAALNGSAIGCRPMTPRFVRLHDGDGDDDDQRCLDFVTGGGFFEPAQRLSGDVRPEGDKKVNFGFNAGQRSVQNPEIKGHFNLIDHNDGTHISGDVMDYGQAECPEDTDDVTNQNCRFFSGEDPTINGESIDGFFFVVICDNDEPGRDDRIVVVLETTDSEDPSPFYSAHNAGPCPTDSQVCCGDLDGGNIQLHKPEGECPQLVRVSPDRRRKTIKA